ncbi:hypothetical protein HMPREF3159_03475 [Brachybacterium sp. HMSC06H03]|uniref:hypothetical protein n=1 Tax=Brachybacterium sp. HMSC06H03 TaxID=1581127 RepID=UPI0008A3D040|nr:hypothetical protein [Brachybacterium sp. HMSC06H03]OFT62585.1 hypothetical protein HMPREF3159_03475 [Brachybacterium sp. HMSC06H03]
MTSNHIDQLAQWWETAEQGTPKPGDTIIIDLGKGGYMIDTTTTDWSEWERYGDTRILERAPKPKPAWRRARAVIASAHVGDGDHFAGVWVRDGEYTWQSEEGICVHADTLSDVTPLIEAKVTDEMVARVCDVLRDHYGTRDNGYTATEVVTAALGLDAE